MRNSTPNAEQKWLCSFCGSEAGSKSRGRMMGLNGGFEAGGTQILHSLQSDSRTFRCDNAKPAFFSRS